MHRIVKMQFSQSFNFHENASDIHHEAENYVERSQGVRIHSTICVDIFSVRARTHSVCITARKMHIFASLYFVSGMQYCSPSIRRNYAQSGKFRHYCMRRQSTAMTNNRKRNASTRRNVLSSHHPNSEKISINLCVHACECVCVCVWCLQ